MKFEQGECIEGKWSTRERDWLQFRLTQLNILTYEYFGVGSTIIIYKILLFLECVGIWLLINKLIRIMHSPVLGGKGEYLSYSIYSIIFIGFCKRVKNYILWKEREKEKVQKLSFLIFSWKIYIIVFQKALTTFHTSFLTTK